MPTVFLEITQPKLFMELPIGNMNLVPKDDKLVFELTSSEDGTVRELGEYDTEGLNDIIVIYNHQTTWVQIRINDNPLIMYKFHLPEDHNVQDIKVIGGLGGCIQSVILACGGDQSIPDEDEEHPPEEPPTMDCDYTFEDDFDPEDLEGCNTTTDTEGDPEPEDGKLCLEEG